MPTADKINNIAVSDLSAIDGKDIGDLSAIMGVTIESAPPVPDFTNTVSAWGLFNWNPVGYPGQPGVEAEGSEGGDFTPFFDSSPYALDWAHLALGGGDPPYILDTWFDQNVQTNNLTQTGAARPVLDATNKWISFDGVGTGLAGTGDLLSGSGTGTIYLSFKAGSLVETSVILETGIGAADQAWRISVQMVAGVFTAAIYDNTAVACLPNSKIKTIADNNWHFVAFTWDITQGTLANQTALKIDNSTSGVTSPASADLVAGGGSIGKAVPSIGARNNAQNSFFTGKMRDIPAVKVVVDDAATQTEYFDRWTYLQTLVP